MNDKKSSNFTESEQELYLKNLFDNHMELNGMTEQTNVWNTKIELENLDLFFESKQSISTQLHIKWGTFC